MRRSTIITLAAAALALTLAFAAIELPTAAAESSLGSGPRFAVATSFRPSRAGFAFRNPAPRPGVSTLASRFVGVCGGMTFASLDFFRLGLQPAASSAGDPYIAKRNLSSIIANGIRFVRWTLAPDRPTWWSPFGVKTATREAQLGRLAEDLRRGPVPIGLVRARTLARVGDNHQVVAYGLVRRGSVVTVRVYDPDQPLFDDVVLRVDLARPDGRMAEYGGSTEVASWRGLFVERYRAAQPQPRASDLPLL